MTIPLTKIITKGSIFICSVLIFVSSVAHVQSSTPAKRLKKQAEPQCARTMLSSLTAGQGFVENKGQVVDQHSQPNNEVLFLYRSKGLNIQLKANSFSYDSYIDTKKDITAEHSDIAAGDACSRRAPRPVPCLRSMHRVDISLVGSNKHPRVSSYNASSDYLNFFNQATPEQGALGVRSYSRVVYHDIYDGIDLEFFLDAQQRAEYQFIVHPGADASRIRLRYDGADAIKLRFNNTLNLSLRHTTLNERIPKSYIAETNEPIRVRYHKESVNEFSFRTAGYSPTHTLIIDPIPSLSWGTYFGGDSLDVGTGVTVDKSSNVLSTGYTNSATYIASTGAYQSVIGSLVASDAFIAKFTRDGVRLWSTYYGGIGYDFSSEVATDPSNNIVIVGHTESSSGIATPGAFQTTPGSGFIAKFLPDGSRQWGSYVFGASYVHLLSAVSIDAASNIFVCGTSGDANLATTGTHQFSCGGATDAIIMKFSSSGARSWSSYFGGTGIEEANDISCDYQGYISICGTTFSSTGIGFFSGFQQSYGGLGDGFVARFTPAGSLSFGSYYGGNLADAASGICCDLSANIYVCGRTATTTTGVISTAGTAQPLFNGGLSDAFVVKFGSTGGRLWGTYYGGSQTDFANNGVSCDINGNVVLLGTTGNNDGIATTGVHQTLSGGGDDAFLVKLNTNGALRWGTFYGGPGDELAWGIATEGSARIYATGQTKSTIRISTPGAFKTTLTTAQRDAFLANFWDCAIPDAVIESEGSPALCQGEVTRYKVVGTTGDVYQWTNPRLGNIVTATNGVSVLIQWTQLGKDTVRMRQTNPSSGCYKDAMFIVTVYANPTVNAGPAITLCKGDKTVLDAQATGGSGVLSYSWSPSDSLSATDVLKPVASPRATTTYTLTVSDTRGCMQTSSVVVTVVDKPIANAGPAQNICSGVDVTIGTPAKPHYIYNWTPYATLNSANVAQPRARPSVTTTYQLVVTNDSTHCTDTSRVVVRVQKPEIQLNPTTVDFGSLGSCESSKDVEVSLTNTGSDSLFITKQNAAASFSLVSPLPFGIAKGASKKVILRFTPSSQGQSTGVLSLVAGPCAYSLDVSCKGQRSALSVATNKAALNYGTSVTCQSVVKWDSVITLTNNSSDTMSVSLLPIAAPFSLVSPSFPLKLNPKAITTVVVRYAPINPGQFNSELRFPLSWAGCSDTISIALSAEDVDPQAAASVSTIAFGEILGCDPPRDTIITITNNSNIAVEVFSASVSTTDFSLETTLPLKLQSHESRQIHIRYKPSANGSSTGSLKLKTTPCDHEILISLQGSKQGVSFVAPDTIQMPDVILCKQAKSSRTFTVLNSSGGGIDASISSITLSPIFSTDAVSGATLPNGIVKQFTIEYDASSASEGTMYGTMLLTLQPCGIVKTIVLKTIVSNQQLSVDSLVDFGIVNVPNTATRTITVHNRGSVVVTVPVLQDLSAPFSLQKTTPSLPRDVVPGDSVVIELKYTAPSNPGVYNSNATCMVLEPCISQLTTVLRAQTDSRRDTVRTTMKVNDINATPGDSVLLVLSIAEQSGLQLSSAPHNFTARVAYNRNLLFFTSNTPLCSSPTSDECELTIQGSRAGSDTLAMLPAIATLGNTNFDALRLVDFHWTDGTADTIVRLQNGSIKVNGSCVQSTVRLYIPTQTATSLLCRPLPLTSNLATVEYGLAEDSEVTLDLLNAGGLNVVRLLNRSSKLRGMYIETFDVSALANGSYFLSMKTQNYSLFTRIDIVR